jgi:hypothetical protein
MSKPLLLMDLGHESSLARQALERSGIAFAEERADDDVVPPCLITGDGCFTGLREIVRACRNITGACGGRE